PLRASLFPYTTLFRSVCIDATCPDVEFTHDLIREKTADDYDVIYIGKKDHPEPEGAVGVSPDHVHLIETPEDVQALPDGLSNKKDRKSTRLNSSHVSI